ncbi:Sodium:dicarboxylate symporter [Phytophthora cactorum]|nr:Sodium:dicarboxylate symporter [Phytophthora cactorum]
MDVFANAAGVRPPAPIVLLDEEQQRIIRDGQSQRGLPPIDDEQPARTGSTGNDALFVPTTPPMLPIPQHVAPQAPPPPTTTYLRTDFTTGRRPAASVTTTNTQKSYELGDGIRTNFTTNRQNPNPVAAFMKENAPDNSLSNSLSAPTDYANVEPTAMPFISSTDPPPEEARPDPTRGFRGNGTNLKLSVRYMIIGAIVGIALGIVFAHVGVSNIAAQWISLPGDLFLRAVNALVVPYVFCSVAVAVGDIVFVGKVSIVGLQTLKIFATGWVVSTALGISVAFVFRPLFRLKTNMPVRTLMLWMLSNNSITCSSNATALSLDNAFVLDDVNSVFETNSDALISTLESVVPDNIFSSLADGDLLAIITFAMVLGSIAGRSYFSKTRRVNYLYLVLLQLRNTFFLAMEWVIWITPVAVVSTISGAFASNQDAVSQLPKVYMFLVACISATALQILVVYPFVIFLLARCNPYAHMHHMIRSYLFAFGSSSSLATAPVTLGCVQKARVCSQSIATFVVSIGVVTNMSGSGWYYPIGIIFLAESSGNGDELTFLRLVAIFFLTIVACAGTPPVPNGGMVLMSTMYKTVFGVSTLPSTWALYVAMDFFADRLSTICNVNDDIMALKVIAENTDETVAGDQLGQRN